MIPYLTHNGILYVGFCCARVGGETRFIDTLIDNIIEHALKTQLFRRNAPRHISTKSLLTSRKATRGSSESILCQSQRAGQSTNINQDKSMSRPDNGGVRVTDMECHIDAALQLEAAHKLVPFQTETLHALGMLQESLGLPLQALEWYERATVSDPTFTSAYVQMGSVLADLDRDSEAVEVLQAAIQLEPDRADAWYILGLVHRGDGSLDHARSAFSKAVALSKYDVAMRATFAALLREVGEFDESFKELLQAKRLAFSSDNGTNWLTHGDNTSLAFPPGWLAISNVTARRGRVVAELNRLAFPQGVHSEWIERLRLIHVTRVATKAECEWAIAVAEAHANATGGWHDRNHDTAKTNNIIVADHEELYRWVQNLLRDGIWPAIKLQFDIEPTELWLEDCFLVKYEACGQAGLEQHIDDSDLSFNLLLSDPASFGGGGTAFLDAEPVEVTVHPEQGDVITHYGHVEHEGKPVVGGAPRYILAGFVRAQPLARRWSQLRW